MDLPPSIIVKLAENSGQWWAIAVGRFPSAILRIYPTTRPTDRIGDELE